MESQSWPPPLDAVHTFTLSMGGGKERVSLALSQVSNEKTSGEPGGLDHVTFERWIVSLPMFLRCSPEGAHSTTPSAALLPLWKLQYGQDRTDLVIQMLEHARQGGIAPDTASGMTFGCYLDGVDSIDAKNLALDDIVHGMAVVRIEEGTSPIDEKIMIIDAVLVSPAIPQRSWPQVHLGILQSLHAMGKAHNMDVQSWTEYDV